jgi:hypothetical protein
MNETRDAFAGEGGAAAEGRPRDSGQVGDRRDVLLDPRRSVSVGRSTKRVNETQPF